MDDEPFPGLVEVRLIDAAGQSWSLIDKCAMFAQFGELTPESDYPVEVTVACVVQGDTEATGGGEFVTVSTSPDMVATPDGQDTFTVRRDQLIP